MGCQAIFVIFLGCERFFNAPFSYLGACDSGRCLTSTGFSLCSFVHAHTVDTEQSYLSTILFAICNVHVYNKSYTVYAT